MLIYRCSKYVWKKSKTQAWIRYSDFCEELICNVCADPIQKLSSYEWDDQRIIGLYELM